ncbi:MAG TPA: NADH-quinone oxidoreductase subunit N [Acidimicrobiia bacterium]
MFAVVAANTPHIDWLTISPEVALVATIVVVLIADLFLPRRDSWQTSRIASIGVLVSLAFVAILGVHSALKPLFGGAYVVDDYALALKGFFLVATYLTILLSVDYISEGDYYQGEFYFLLLCSVLGMTVMASARDLVTLFVALETISIPTYILAGWRKHDRRSNEAAIKYYLIGAISSAVMLYGMSLIFGLTGSTLLPEIAHNLAHVHNSRLLVVAIFLSLIGFAFKVSAVPFHWWAPDTYEGAPTPVTAFLSVASKAGGFVALLNIVFFGFGVRADAWVAPIWIIAVASMVLGNLTALRQTNMVRMLAYSSVAQGGFMLVPFAAYGIAQGNHNRAVAQTSFEAVIVYLLIYGAMNLGAFACVIAIARRTRSADIEGYSGLFNTSPALTVLMTMFLASLAGIPPLAGWFAKFTMFRAAIEAGGWAGASLAIIAGVMSVVAAFYYLNVVRTMWFRPAPAAAEPVKVPAALATSMALCAGVVIVVGVYPQLIAHIGDLASKVTG